MGRLVDTVLQLIFVAGIVVVLLLLYFTRIAPLRADVVGEGLTGAGAVWGQYENLTTVYQFEQEEKRLQTRIELLRAEYAAAVTDYTGERRRLEESAQWSELEKREKMASLEQVYPQNYFTRKLDLIEQEQAQLQRLLTLKCQKYCSYEDLPAG